MSWLQVSEIRMYISIGAGLAVFALALGLLLIYHICSKNSLARHRIAVGTIITLAFLGMIAMPFLVDYALDSWADLAFQWERNPYQVVINGMENAQKVAPIPGWTDPLGPSMEIQNGVLILCDARHNPETNEDGTRKYPTCKLIH